MPFKCRILIIDDERSILEMLERWFTRQGLDVVVAETGEEALKHLKSGRNHIVLTDIVIPGTDGYSVLSLIRQEYPDTAVIMMTGYGDTHTVRDALDRGADEFISKPFNFAEMSSVLEKVTWRYMPRWEKESCPAGV